MEKIKKLPEMETQEHKDYIKTEIGETVFNTDKSGITITSKNSISNRYGLPKEKIDFLKEVNAKELKEPYIYAIRGSHHFFSLKYLMETPVDELRKVVERFRKD